MDENPPASIALQNIGIPHTVFRHTGQVNSLEQAAQERGQRPAQVVRSILFRLGEDQYLMALIGGPAQISWKRLRKHLGQSRLTMASEEEVLAVTGYRVGAVSPFGLPRPIKVLIDPELLKESEVSLGSGVRSVAIVMKSSDMLKALDEPEIVELVGAA